MVFWGVVIASVAVTVVEAPTQLRHLRSDVEAGSNRPKLDRELQPARTVGLVDPGPFVVAERTIPRGARFYVSTDGAEAAVRRWARPFAQYWLLPRRMASTPRQADWILAYGPFTRPGLSARRVVRLAPGVRLVEVAGGP
jgi:hypothetical protein